MKKKIGRREFSKNLCLAAAGPLAASLGSGTASFAKGAGRKKPNIIYILADDLGYAEVGCYGQKKIKTHNIDRLAREGMLFTQHYSGNPVCAPSRCSFMTGLHTGHTEVRGNKQVGGSEGWKLGSTTGGQWPLSEKAVTVASLLKKAGYTTGAFGKWGLGTVGTTGDPNRQGIDEFYGYICQRQAHTFYPNHLWHNDKVDWIPENEGGKEVTYSHDKIAQHALDFLTRNKDKPFFLYVPFTIPHVSLQVPKESLAQYSGKWEETPFKGSSLYTPQKEPRATYAAMVSHMDRDVGRIMDMVKKFDLERDTLIIFTSDNGPTFNGGSDSPFFESAGPLHGLKGSGYEGGIRVPFIASWKGKIEAGSTSGHVSAFWDMLPTFCELAGAKTPRKIDGISMVPTLLGWPEKQKQHELLYWELGGQQAIRMGDWKAYRKNPDAALELYDLKADIGESKDLAAERPDIAKKMEKLMETARTESEEFPLRRSKSGKTGRLLPKKGTLAKDKWKVVSIDSESKFNGKLGASAIDGNPQTWWHTEFQKASPSHPHEIVIDLGETRRLKGLRYLARQDVGTNGMIKDFEIYLSDSPDAFGNPVLKDRFKDTKNEQEATFPEKKARYVKLRALSAVRGEVFTSAGEIGLVGK